MVFFGRNVSAVIPHAELEEIFADLLMSIVDLNVYVLSALWTVA